MQISQQNLNRGTLALAFLVGGGCITYLKLQDFLTYVIIAFPIVILLIYWLTALAISDKSVYEIIGDNCYYLGFVFTLISLAITLYLLYEPIDAAPKGQVLGKTISGFGVALSSTIVGIVLRVLMQKMVPDILQQEGEARADLDFAIRDFRTHLGMSIGELKRYSVETSQILAEQRDAVQKVLEKDTDAHKRAAEASTAALIKFSKDTEKTLINHRAALLESLEHDTHAYHQAAQEGIAVVREALDRVSATLQVLESGASGLRGVLEQTVKAFAEFQDEAGRLASLSRLTFEQTGESVEVARKELERMKALIARVSAMSNKTSGLDEALSGVIGILTTVEDGISTKLDSAVARMSERAIAVSAVLTESSGKLKSAAERFEAASARTEAADMQTNIAGAAERIADAAARLETANTRLAVAIEKLDELADEAAKPRRTGILGIFGSRGR